jgi:dolichol-phosphate mannosyltransferase
MSCSTATDRDRSHRDRLVSIVLPAFNEAQVLPRLCDRITASLSSCDVRYEIIFVDDGSTDESAEVLSTIADQDARVRVIHFSRNFGHQAAIHAGLLHSRGDAIVLMDSDLQDDPACLPEFISKWRQGFDVIYAIRANRKENPAKRFLFYSFYRLLNLVAQTPMPMDAGNFGLVDRSVLQQIIGMVERDRYFPGLRNWVGFRQTGITVERGQRHDNQPRVSLLQLFQLAKTAIFSFSRVPLSLFYALAVVSIGICLACTGFTLYHRLFTGLAVPGWASITIVASLFGALNSLGIAVLGEYVIRIYDQVRGRPQFIVSSYQNFEVQTLESTEDQILQTIDELRMPASSCRGKMPRSATFPNLGQGSATDVPPPASCR